MTGRPVFFSFHYRRDIWRASNIRKSNQFSAQAAAGWTDASLWEKAKLTGSGEVRRLIESGLADTSVTVVLIGAETSKRRWVDYEIRRSYERGNGVIGVRIHRLADQFRKRDIRGDTPAALIENQAFVRDYNSARLGSWIELAAIGAGKKCLQHGERNCLQCRLAFRIFS